MKKSLLLVLFVVFAALMYAQDKQTEISAPITEVKLHLAGAQILRSAKVTLKPGRNHFVLPDLSSKLHGQTIQVACSDQYVKIISVTSKTNFLRKGKEDRRISALRDSVAIVHAQIDKLNDEKSAYVEEKELLKANRQFKGNDKTLTVAELKSTADFFRSRMLDINNLVTKTSNSLEKNHRKLFDLKLQLNELNAGKEPTAEIFLVLETNKNAATDIEVRYVVKDAGWAALYDLESSGATAPVILKYKALAFNNTGIDWDDVKLTLSTADPLESASQPCLKVWDISDYSSDQITINNSMVISNSNVYSNGYQENSIQNYQSITQDLGTQQKEIRTILGADWNTGIDYETEMYRRYQAERVNAPLLNRAVLDVPEFNADFPIAEPYSIPSDKKPYSIDIDTYNLPVSYKFFTVPKLDKDAFLLAQIVGWEDLNLVSGPVNIFQGNRFIGQSNLDIRNLSDTLSVSLGRDKNVVVSRVKVKGKVRNQLLGATKKSAVAYNISVHNTHNYPIDVEIQDQVPISNDKEVIVTIDEMADASYAEKIGVLTWALHLEAGETKTIEFGFNIRYPKNKAVQIQYKKSRQMEQMRYF